ncbi:MAG TPA: hypothetical protein VLQ93_08400, partial [Myxococcaceae bacterium]|nr:hypothetical protein [Myxococcaceae bacterium]
FFNWELFSTTIAARAIDERSLSWAHIALMAFGVLAERAPDAYEAYSFMLRAMNLRAAMILELGSREGDTVLDPEIIVAWFKNLVTMPIEEVARMSSEDLRTIPIETIRKLRNLKYALNVVDLVCESETGVVRKHPELEGWLQLRPRIP